MSDSLIASRNTRASPERERRDLAKAGSPSRSSDSPSSTTGWRALSIGPSIKYDSGKGWFVTAKYQMESEVRNRTQGAAFWAKAVVPF